MTAEQFVYWLSGFLEGSARIIEEDATLIKEKINDVTSPIKNYHTIAVNATSGNLIYGPAKNSTTDTKEPSFEKYI